MNNDLKIALNLLKLSFVLQIVIYVIIISITISLTGEARFASGGIIFIGILIAFGLAVIFNVLSYATLGSGFSSSIIKMSKFDKIRFIMWRGLSLFISPFVIISYTVYCFL